MSAGGQRDGEARLLAAIASALERAAARAEPVSVVVAVALSDDHAREVLDASRGELPPEGLAVPMGGGRLGLLLPAVALGAAQARAGRIAATCRGTSCGAAAAGEGGPVGPDTLLAEAEADALGALRRARGLAYGDEEVGGA